MHNTTKLLGVEHQNYPFQTKPQESDNSNPFYRYNPDQCIMCGRCVEACQDLQVNETLSIRSEDPHPACCGMAARPLGSRGFLRALVCASNVLMEKSWLGHAGFLTGLSKHALNDMIDVVKGQKSETGYTAILKVSEVESTREPSRERFEVQNRR